MREWSLGQAREAATLHGVSFFYVSSEVETALVAVQGYAGARARLPRKRSLQDLSNGLVHRDSTGRTDRQDTAVQVGRDFDGQPTPSDSAPVAADLVARRPLVTSI